MFSFYENDSNWSDQKLEIKQNEALHDLERKTAKISALTSNNLNKYKSLMGEDLDLKSSTVC